MGRGERLLLDPGLTYREDESRVRERHLRENLAWLNRFSLSLLNRHPRRESVAMKRRGCGWSDDYLMGEIIVLQSNPRRGMDQPPRGQCCEMTPYEKGCGLEPDGQ